MPINLSDLRSGSEAINSVKLFKTDPAAIPSLITDNYGGKWLRSSFVGNDVATYPQAANYDFIGTNGVEHDISGAISPETVASDVTYRSDTDEFAVFLASTNEIIIINGTTFTGTGVSWSVAGQTTAGRSLCWDPTNSRYILMTANAVYFYNDAGGYLGTDGFSGETSAQAIEYDPQADTVWICGSSSDNALEFDLSNFNATGRNIDPPVNNPTVLATDGTYWYIGNQNQLYMYYNDPAQAGQQLSAEGRVSNATDGPVSLCFRGAIGFYTKTGAPGVSDHLHEAATGKWYGMPESVQDPDTLLYYYTRIG